MLVKRVIEREGDTIKMFSTYDHSDVLEQNYKERMSGDDGYIDMGKDFMKVGSIPIAFFASLSAEQKDELESNPQKLLQMLKEHPEFRTNTKRL